MRLHQFNPTQENYQTRLSIYSWSLTVFAKASSPITAFSDNIVIVRFPILNATVGNTRMLNLETEGTISFDVDISLYAQSEERALHDIENAGLIEVISVEGMQTLIPSIAVNG